MADLTDKEITEACARAMGISVVAVNARGERQPPYVEHWFSGNPMRVYDPLRDDAQAMALIHKFKLGLSYGAEGWIVDGPASHHLEQDLNRGICKAVARMQIEKEKNA